MVLIENRSDTGYVRFFYYAINNAYLLYKHNVVKLLIRRSRCRKRPVVPQSSSHSRDGVPIGCSLCRVGEVGISRGTCCHCLDVGKRPVHHIIFACSFYIIKFVSARFPVLQTITRTELYVVSC